MKVVKTQRNGRTVYRVGSRWFYRKERAEEVARKGLRKTRPRRAAKNPGVSREHLLSAVPPEVRAIARALSGRGGVRVNLVGGAVIDLLQGREVKDWDLEVFGLSWEELLTRAKRLGRASEVGKSFGIVKLTTPSGLDLDLSIPRKDSKVGEGHTGFDVSFDPRMSTKEAARRRDFTLNSMAVDLTTGELHDPFGGLGDLEAGVLRVTDAERFRDDPLRGLRAMQLLARKAKTVDPASMQVIRDMRHSHPELPKERLGEEWRKLMLKAERPSLGLQFLKDSGWIEYYPELDVLESIPQHPEWHPEGDVWVHTKAAADAAARVRHLVPDDQREAFMFGTTFHDLGKATTTITPEMVAADEAPLDRLFTAHGHDTAGQEPMRHFAERVGLSKKGATLAEGIVGAHMRPYSLHAGKAGRSAYARLARDMKAIGGDLPLLAKVCQCDACATGSGRGFTPTGDPDWEHDISQNLLSWEEEVGGEKQLPLVQGRDLIAMGLKPGVGFAPLLKTAQDLQDEGHTREEILTHLRSVML